MDKLINEERKKYGKIEVDSRILSLSWSSLNPNYVKFTIDQTSFSIRFSQSERLVKVLEAMGALPNLEIRDKVVTNG